MYRRGKLGKYEKMAGAGRWGIPGTNRPGFSLGCIKDDVEPIPHQDPAPEGSRRVPQSEVEYEAWTDRGTILSQLPLPSILIHDLTPSRPGVHQGEFYVCGAEEDRRRDE